MIQQFIQMSLKNYKQYFLAQCKIFAFMAMIFIIGLYFIGIDKAIWIGLGIAVFDLLPLVGSGLIFIPWSIFELVSQHQDLAWQLALLYIVAFIIKQFIEPLFIGKNLSLPFYIPLGITLICGSIFNIFGVVLAALIIPLITTLYEMMHMTRQSRNISSK